MELEKTKKQLNFHHSLCYHWARLQRSADRVSESLKIRLSLESINVNIFRQSIITSMNCSRPLRLILRANNFYLALQLKSLFVAYSQLRSNVFSLLHSQNWVGEENKSLGILMSGLKFDPHKIFLPAKELTLKESHTYIHKTLTRRRRRR